MSARELAVWGALALAALDGLVGLFGALRWYRVAPSREFWLGVRAGQALALLYAALAVGFLASAVQNTVDLVSTFVLLLCWPMLAIMLALGAPDTARSESTDALRAAA